MKKLVVVSKILRNNMTSEENKLWYDFLKKIPVNVYRQKIIWKYIVDFYIPESKLIIEIDGSQHYEGEQKEKDIERDKYFFQKGYTVIRYSNIQINKNFEAVCKDIIKRIPSLKNYL